jgi:hypothetical protein
MVSETLYREGRKMVFDLASPSAVSLETEVLSEATSATVHILDLILALGLDQLQDAELVLRDIGQRDRQPDVLRVQNSEAPAHESAVRRVGSLGSRGLG